MCRGGRDRGLHVFRSFSRGGSGVPMRFRRSTDNRVPGTKIGSRTGVDAAGLRGNVRCLSGGVCIVKEGMSQEDTAKLVEAGFSKMGLHGGALVLLGAS